jgi:hypothetical protein
MIKEREAISVDTPVIVTEGVAVATMMQVSALADVEHLVEVEVEAYLQDSRP